jgi:hypothetical protein
MIPVLTNLHRVRSHTTKQICYFIGGRQRGILISGLAMRTHMSLIQLEAHHHTVQSNKQHLQNPEVDNVDRAENGSQDLALVART